jgi:hypothetical protein
MSVEPPNECDSAIFNATCWIGDPTLTGNYVEFPVAQGNNTLLDVTANNILVTDSGVIQGALLVSDLATLSAGVLTDTINTITAGSVLSIGTDSTHTGNTLIGGSNVNSKIFIDTGNTGNTNSDPAISIGTSAAIKTIKIGNSVAITASSVHLSRLDIQGHQLNNIVNATGDVDIANLQTTGVLNIGTAVTKTTAINIGCNTGIVLSALPINIGNKSSGTVNIGQATTSVTFNSSAGTSGQLLSSNGTGNIPTWINAPVGINYKTDTIVPGATALSGSYLFTTVGGTPFTATPKITLTGFVSAGTTIVVVGVSAKSNLGFSWLASSTGLAGIDYIAVQS